MKRIIIPLVFAVIGSFSVACIKDDPAKLDPECGRMLDVRSEDGDNAQVHDVKLYIYDDNGKLIDYQTTSVATPINIDPYRAYGHIKVLAWGNTQDNPAAHTLSAPVIGSSIADHKLTQNTNGNTFGPYALTHAPADLFYGAMDISFSTGSPYFYAEPNVTTTVYVNRGVSSYILTIPRIGETFDGPDSNYQVVIRHPNTGLDANGNPIPGETTYLPEVSYDPDTDTLTTPIQTALPTGSEGMIIEIYSNGVLVYTATLDKDGHIIALVPNRLHNILIDLGASMDVTVVVTDWEEVYIFQDF